MKKIKDRISNFYNKLIKTKEHIWSHCLALTGWILLLLLIIAIKDDFIILACMYILIYSILFYTPFIIIFLIESIFFRNCKIPINFLYNNPIYHLIWLVGIICSLIPIYIIIIFSIIPIIFNFFNSIYYKILSRIILG